MTSTPQDPSGSNPPQWNDPGQQSQPPQYPGQQPPQYPGQSSQGSGQQPPQYPGQSSQGSYPAYSGAQGSDQYGSQYGGSQYGGSQYGSGYSQGGGMSRPATVTAAAVITIVMSALTGLFWVGLGLAMILAGDSITDALLDEPDVMSELDRANITPTQLQDGISVFGVVCLVIGLLMLAVILAARGVLKGSNGARIVVVVAAVLTLLFGLLLITSVISILWMIAAIAVIVLLYVGDANRWFDKSRR
jgi:hypothetical protein